MLEERDGFVRVRAHVPVQVQNLRRYLFGGFTPTYINLVVLCTVQTATQPTAEPVTLSMRIDYFEPIIGPEFIIESRILKKRGRITYVEARLFDPPDTLAVVAQTTLCDRDPQEFESEAE